MTKNEQDFEMDTLLMDSIVKNLPCVSGAQCEHPPLITRNELLAFNASVILLLTNRLKGKRFRPQGGDVIKLGYIRALIQALQSYNEILKTSELDEIERKIKTLESQQL